MLSCVVRLGARCCSVVTRSLVRVAGCRSRAYVSEVSWRLGRARCCSGPAVPGGVCIE